jgi:microcystin-dependent protein
MAALNFKITNSGLALLSQVSTIGPVTLTKVAIGSAGYTASGSETALTTQIKQITPEGSSVPAPGIIHITASDSSTDAYSVKEIGLFAGSTLFAIYSQSAAILTKSSGNVALFSIDLALTNVPAGSVTIGAASFQYPPATEAVKGVAEIATTAEVAAGTNDSHIVTPLKLAGSPTFVKKSGDTMTGALILPGDPTIPLHAATKQYVDAALNPLAGAVMGFARSTAPSGWLKANGAAVSRTAYASLFSAIGTTFGAGDGSTTFNLPDLRGEFVRGWDDGRGVDVSRTLGSSQLDDFKSHTHNLSLIASLPVNNTTVSREPLLTENTNQYLASNAPGYVIATGGTETRPRNVALLFCIKF